ncbi:MAG: GC-type dockerin domain-anchored protein [Phycisphaerales bacterium]
MPRSTRPLSACCVLGATVILGIGNVSLAQCDPEWTQLEPATTPPPRWFGAMTYDSQRDRLVMFGGFNPSGNLGDTWEFDGTDWALRSTTGPGPRRAVSMAYDSARGVTVLFGGISNTATVGDTWEWDGSAWTQVATTGPTPQGEAALVFDSDRGVTVFFGASGNTWEWNGSVWAFRTDSGPFGRSGTANAYDAARHRTHLFGGTGGTEFELDENWVFDGTSWSQIVPPLSPRPRREAAMAFDSARVMLVLFGGHYGRITSSELGDTWEYDGNTWTQRMIPGPAPRGGACVAYDSTRHRVVIFGGGYGVLDDTWIYTAGAGAPTVTTQPMSQTVAFDSDVTFGVVAQGDSLTYQWQRDGAALADGGRVSGATTAMLHIADAVEADTGDYSVVVSSPCSFVTSLPAHLSVGICPAEYNNDEVLNSDDFFDFVHDFFTNDPRADFDHSGSLDSNDFFAFIAAFFSGCQ